VLLAVGMFSGLGHAFSGGGWVDLGNDLAGTHGSPVLSASGHLVDDTPASITLSNVLAQSSALGVVGVTTLNAPFNGGILVPLPALIFALPTGGTPGTPSTVTLNSNIPAGTPVGTQFFLQFWVLDSAGAQGWAASNAIQGTTRTLFDVISEEIDCMLDAAGNPGGKRKIYLSQDHTNQIYVRRPHCWAASVDLTGLSPWNQTGGATRAGTLISPRHIAFAKHYPLSTTPGNNQLVFVTADDVTVTRNLTAVSYPGGDIGIGVLDADVPATISFHRVLPTNWGSDLSSVNGLPMLHLDQEEKALVRDMSSLGANCLHRDPTDPTRLSYSETLIGGDSGNPGFLIIGGEAVLILTHHTSVNGPSYTFWYDQVNAAMTALGGGYQLTPYDFDAFLQQLP
jgi:hypothetical protein